MSQINQCWWGLFKFLTLNSLTSLLKKTSWKLLLHPILWHLSLIPWSSLSPSPNYFSILSKRKRERGRKRERERTKTLNKTTWFWFPYWQFAVFLLATVTLSSPICSGEETKTCYTSGTSGGYWFLTCEKPLELSSWEESIAIEGDMINARKEVREEDICEPW